jgi:hypothetical protein
MDVPSLEDLEGVLKELTEKRSEEDVNSELPPAPRLDEPKATLNPEDIEALFEE